MSIMGYLPFEQTTISPNRSILKIIEMLEQVGFREVAQFSVEGVKSVVARHNGAVFKFSVNLDVIKAKLSERRRRGRKAPDLQALAERIGWRILHERVKGTVDSVKYEVETIAEALGGRLLTQTKQGKEIYLADYIVEKIEAGQIAAGQLTAPLIGMNK